MREAPRQFERYSVISFDLLAASTAQVHFDLLCKEHGNLDSYSWTAGGEEKTYTIARGDFLGYADESDPMHKWNLQVQTEEGDTLEITINCLNAKLTNTAGDPCSFQEADEVHRAIVDAAFERNEKDNHICKIRLPGGVLLDNPSLGE